MLIAHFTVAFSYTRSLLQPAAMTSLKNQGSLLDPSDTSLGPWSRSPHGAGYLRTMTNLIGIDATNGKRLVVKCLAANCPFMLPKLAVIYKKQ